MKKIKLTLVGNTNAGKTTLLNTLAGTKKEISNYPGTTVAIFESNVLCEDVGYRIVDLPGAYDMSPYSEEERVTKQVVEDGDYDLLVQVIDMEFVERSLMFTLELLEKSVRRER